MVDHIPWKEIAKQEKTSVQNIRKIVERALSKVKPPE
jgi:transcriptional regulator